MTSSMGNRTSTGGGIRTHTAREDHRILNPTRLPIPPLRHIRRTVYRNRDKSSIRRNGDCWKGDPNPLHEGP